MTAGLRLPPPLQTGDCVAVVAPASPFPPEPFERGMAFLRARFRVRVDPGIASRTGYLAGDDARRAAELSAAMRDPEVKAIVAARGGYGALRIVDDLPWGAFADAPKWLAGFSDVTALHARLWALGVASIHGPNVTGLGEGTRQGEAWLAALGGTGAAARWSGLHVVHAGVAHEGPVVGGNLSLVHAMAASGQLALPDGCVLALEDVTERPYRVDRLLTALRWGGHLERVGAVVFGSFDQCDPGPDGVRVEDVLGDRTRALGVPVVSGAPFGHGEVNDAFVLGAVVRVTTDAEGVVAFAAR